MTCLIAATLAAAACRSSVEDCDGPAHKAFILDRALDERRVTELLANLDAAAPDELFCDDVCGALLIEQPDDLTVDTCKLGFTGERTGDPGHILGSVSCQGRINYYCL